MAKHAIRITHIINQQDGYLNPDRVSDHYIAAWVALEDIDPNAGPFQARLQCSWQDRKGRASADGLTLHEVLLFYAAV